MSALARAGELVLRPVAGPADEELIATWLAGPELAQWWDPGDDEAEPGVERCIAEEGGRPVGHVQLYPVGPYWEAYRLAGADDADGVWALDLFVGDPGRWGSGLGTRVLRLAVDHLLVDRGARRVLIDPRVDNARARRSYEKAGFREVGVLGGHDVNRGVARDCVLMALDALDDPVGLTAHLARIDSVNPSLVPGAAGERAMADAVAAWAAARGFEVARDEVAPGRWNVVARRRGSGGGRALVLNGHLDTVGPRATPVVLGDGRLEGRGVLDTKGGLAAALLAAAAVPAADLAGDVVVVGVADEECGSIGTEAVVGAVTADAALVLEPTDLRVVHRHRGFATVTARITGRAAHTSRPDRGVNAVHAAAAAVRAVAELDEQWAEGADPVTRPATLVSIVRHRGEMFTVPAECEVVAELRTTAGGHEEEVQAVASAIGAAVAAACPQAELELGVGLGRFGLGTADGDPFVRCVADAVTLATGSPAELAAAPYWTDAALHAGAGMPAVVLGPTGQGLHEDLEWVTTESLRQCRSALEALIRAWCGAPALT